MLKREKIEIEMRLDRYCLHLSKIWAYLNFVHPSQEVMIAKWYPLADPIWVPKLLADNKQALILDLNGLLVSVVEGKYGEQPLAYAEEMVKYNINSTNFWIGASNISMFLYGALACILK